MGRKSYLGGGVIRETYDDGRKSMDYKSNWVGERTVLKHHRHNDDGTTDSFDPDDLPLIY